MLNNLVLLGRIVKLPNPLDNVIYINTRRKEKNPVTDTYDTDCFHIYVSDNIRENIINYIQEGDLVGVKGHLETTLDNLFDEPKIICDSLTYLSSRKNDTEEK